MTRVRIKVSMVGVDYDYAVGDEVDLSPDEALRLCAADHAEVVDKMPTDPIVVPVPKARTKTVKIKPKSKSKKRRK